MQSEKVTKPKTINQETWECNQRWLILMNTQSEQHRKIRDPRLYRQSSKQQLITPASPQSTDT